MTFAKPLYFVLFYNDILYLIKFLCKKGERNTTYREATTMPMEDGGGRHDSQTALCSTSERCWSRHILPQKEIAEAYR